MKELQVQKLHPSAKVPTRSYASDAGLDLYAVENALLQPGERTVLRTGIAIAVPEGCVGLVWDRSGLALRSGLKTMGGVIDAGYRGEVQVIAINFGQEAIAIESGQRIAQLLIQKIEFLEPAEVESLDESVRQVGGFGSTGA